MPTKSLLFSSLSVVSILGGCATVQPRQSFPGVADAIAQRSVYRVHWNDGTDADQSVAREVDALLARPLDADAAVQVALLNNRNLQAIYEDLGVAQAELVAAGLLKNPIFDGSVRFVEGGGGTNLDLGIAFDFLDVFFIGLRKNIAAAQLDAAKANVTGAVLDLAGETKSAFFSLQAAEQTVEMRQQIERATAASYDLAKRLREAGNNRPLDLTTDRALHEESRLALAIAEADVTQKRESLNRLMGVWGARTTWTTAGRLAEPSDDAFVAADVERRAIERSLDLQSSLAEVTVALRELGITKPLGYLSELEVGALGERDDGEWETGPSVSLPIPLFSQGQPAVARAQAELRRAQQRYYATAVEVRSAARAAFTRTRALRQQVDFYRNVLLPLRQSVVDDTQLQYNAMQIGAFQLLQAKRDQIETGGDYLTVLRDYWIARAQLELILNGRMSRAALPDAAPPMPSRGGGSEGAH